MAQKQRADKQKEKEKKEKIALVALVGLLVIVGAFELPKMLKKDSAAPAVTAAQTTSSSGLTSAVTTSASGVTTAGSGPSAAGSLPNASTYEPGVGQLSDFSLFNGRDPFGNVKAATGASATSSSTTSSTKTSTTATTSPSVTYVAAKISINGTSEPVILNGAFPAASPAFVLNSFSTKEIKISVNGGSFASGQGKVTIKKGKSVVLVNTVDSIRYVIKYVGALSDEQLAEWIASTTTSATSTGTTETTTPATTTG